MNRAIPGRNAFVAAYVLLAIGFLTIHFTRVDNFSTVVGGIAVKGRSSIGTVLSPPQVRQLRISANGVELHLTKRQKAVLVTDDGIRHPLDVIGWTVEDQSVRIDLSSGTEFTVVSDPHGAAVSLIPGIPTTIPPVRSLELPLGPAGGTEISIPGDIPGALSIITEDTEYIASLPSDSTWNPGVHRLNLVVLDKADPIVAITEDSIGGGQSALDWFAGGTVPSQDSYSSAVDTWAAFARRGWDARVDSRAGLWFDEKGEARWDDTLAAAVLADSVAGGNLPTRLQSVMAIAEGAPKEIGWLPSPYLGNIVNQSRVRGEEIRRDARTLIASMDDGDPAFRIALALSALVDTGSIEEAARMVEAARTGPPPETPNEDVIDRLEILHEARDLGLDDAAGDPSIRKGHIDEYIVPRIFWVKDGLWLVENDGSIDLSLSVAAGVLLMREAQWSNEGVYQALGRQLVVSALGFADENGMIPRRILFESSGEVVKEGLIAPERLYADIVDPPAYPRAVSLSRELGSGAWALTGAERFTVRSTPRETTVTMDFPAGSIHHLAISGIKPFSVLYMNGIRWNGDPNFQRYYAGWYYDEAAETLYVKIRHRAKTETIRILYYDPDAPVAETIETETLAEGA